MYIIRSMEVLEQLFEELRNNNKYLIEISNDNNNNWKIYINANNLSVNIQTPNSLTSKRITTSQILDYINNEAQNTIIKIKYTCFYDNFEVYQPLIQGILDKIVNAYTSRQIITKYKTYY